jgi:IS5 family transposase
LLQMLYTIRSEQQMVERLQYDLLFRWFVGLGIDDDVFDASTFSKNRDRLLTTDIAQRFLSALLALPQVKRLLSAEHFSVDGALLKAWASMKSFRAKDGSDEPPGPGRNGERNFKKEKRSNETHASTTDPDARLTRKGDGHESRLACTGDALMENRNGLAVVAEATLATGTAERDAATSMTQDLPEGASLGADKNYDADDFVTDLRQRKIKPHIAINGSLSKTGKVRKTAAPPEIAESTDYAISQRCRKRIEEIFGRGKTNSGLGQVKVRGLAKVKAVFTFTLAAYNLIRLPKLLEPAPDSVLREESDEQCRKNIALIRKKPRFASISLKKSNPWPKLRPRNRFFSSLLERFLHANRWPVRLRRLYPPASAGFRIHD